MLRSDVALDEFPKVVPVHPPDGTVIVNPAYLLPRRVEKTTM